MALSERIQSDLLTAMRHKDAVRLRTLRMMKAALTSREIEKRESLSDEEASRTLNTLVKQRRESAEQFRKGGRTDLAEKEEEEIAVIQDYLPAPATEDEIQKAVAAAVEETAAQSLRDMGKVMQSTLSQLSGKTVDRSYVSTLVKNALQSNAGRSSRT